MFTANPVTGTRSETVIDASPGLGEAVVSGAVNPDHFVVDRTTGSVRERRLGDKRLVISGRPGGGTEQQARADDGAPCLDDDQLLAPGPARPARPGPLRRTAGHRMGPRRRWPVWLTQARPITTLYPVPPCPSPGCGCSCA